MTHNDALMICGTIYGAILMRDNDVVLFIMMMISYALAIAPWLASRA